MKKNTRCHICGKSYKTREEKQTDINIALSMITDAIKDQYDRAIVISADTDLVPIIEAVHNIAPDKEVGVAFPLRRYNNSLEKAADFSKTLNEAMMKRCQLPAQCAGGA